MTEAITQPMRQSRITELMIEDKGGRALRTIRWVPAGEKLFIVERKDNRRLELLNGLENLDKKKIKYSLIKEMPTAEATDQFKNGLQLPRDCRLKLVTSETETLVDSKKQDEGDKRFFAIWALLLIFGFAFLYAVRFAPPPTLALKEELQQRIVKIVKKQEVVEKRIQQNAQVEVAKSKPQKVLKRMGALAALGSLKRSAQRGGLDLGAVQTTKGIGLGGAQGSGGTQTSMYAKGLVAAPLGTGGNIKGAGGYGTKGKGGGQAGYGQISLVGSAGTEAVPLGREAIVDGGLDRDLIAEVVRRNQGQIMFCYEQGLQGDPRLSGRVAIKWTIGANGQVKTAQVDGSTVNSKIVEDCILARLKSWKFPLPQGGVDVSVSYPFMLKRAGQG
jgi:hypothetical protein